MGRDRLSYTESSYLLQRGPEMIQTAAATFFFPAPICVKPNSQRNSRSNPQSLNLRLRASSLSDSRFPLASRIIVKSKFTISQFPLLSLSFFQCFCVSNLIFSIVGLLLNWGSLLGLAMALFL